MLGLYCQHLSIVKPTRCTSLSNVFYFEIILHVADGLSVHNQEFKTVHAAAGIYLTDTVVCFTYTCCCMYTLELLMMERPSVTCRILSQNKFERLVHLVGFSYRNILGCLAQWTTKLSTSFMFVVTKAWNLIRFFLARNLIPEHHGSLIRRHWYFPGVEYYKSRIPVTQFSCYAGVKGWGWTIR
jgi:hypothetical protein